MPVNKKYLAAFECGETYHVYNRTNNRELLFRSDDNYYYFLKQFNFYISPFVDTYIWNLLPNHFHFLIRIKSLPEITAFLNTVPVEKQTKAEKQFLSSGEISPLIEMAFTRLFTSYAMAFNKMFRRTGNLFQRTFKRIKIERDSQFTQAIVYIHANAQKHKLIKDFVLHKWCSYHTMISDKPTRLLRNEIIEWFDGREQFIKVHREMADYYYGFDGGIEEDEE
jgi:putative transposase